MENRLVNGLVIGLIMTVVAGTPRCVATPTLRLTLVIYDHAHMRTESRIGVRCEAPTQYTVCIVATDNALALIGSGRA